MGVPAVPAFVFSFANYVQVQPELSSLSFSSSFSSPIYHRKGKNFGFPCCTTHPGKRPRRRKKVLESFATPIMSSCDNETNDQDMKESFVKYSGPSSSSDDVQFEGFLCQPISTPNRPIKLNSLPGVLIVHTAIGMRDPFILEKTRQLSRQCGYVCLAVDIYGFGQLNYTTNKALREPLMQNRSLVQQRALLGMSTLIEYSSFVDPRRIAVIGYCFGGMVALDLARARPPGLQAAVSFHGILDSPKTTMVQKDKDDRKIQTRILVFHGNSDPLIDENQKQDFLKEMQREAADWTFCEYGNTYHAFTRPEKTTEKDLQAGFQYNPLANGRSWTQCLSLLAEAFTDM